MVDNGYEEVLMPANDDEIDQALASLDVAFGAKKEGDLDAARVFFSRAVLKLPKNHDSYPICLSQLAEIEEHNEDWLQALRFNLNLLVELEQRCGERDEKTIATMDKAASLFDKVGRKDESLALYERARTLSERSLWADQANEDISLFEQAKGEPTIDAPATPATPDPSSVSMIMLQAFENAYKPYLTPELIGPEDISLDALDRKLNLKGRLSKMRLDGDKAEEEQSALQKFIAAMRAHAAKAFAPLFKLVNRCLNDRNRVLITVLVATPIMIWIMVALVRQIRGVETGDQYSRVAHRFVSADGQKAFGWLDKDSCELISAANRNKVRARIYSGRAQNLIEMAFMPLIQNQLWIKHEPAMCVDQAGGVMYADAGPESRIIEALQSITRGATYVYLKTGKYPESFGAVSQALADREPSKIAFRDEYTGANLKPIIKSINFQAKTDLEGDQWRAELMRKFKAGELLENEPKFGSGEPRGYSVTVRMPRGEIKYFLTRAADREGSFLRGNAVHEYNYFASDDGHEIKQDKAKPFFDSAVELRQRVVWVIESPLTERSEWLIRNAGTAISFLCSLLLFGSYFSSYKKGFWKNATLLGAILMLLLSIAYYAAPFLP